MRNAILLQWIEQAEARQVLAAALFERAPVASRRTAAGNLTVRILPRMRSWFGKRRPVAQMQPAFIRRVEHPEPPARR
jgi:hypothetical protein